MRSINSQHSRDSIGSLQCERSLFSQGARNAIRNRERVFSDEAGHRDGGVKFNASIRSATDFEMDEENALDEGN